MHIIKFSLLSVLLLTACNNNHPVQSNDSPTDTAFMAGEGLALAYQKGDSVIVTNIDTLTQFSVANATDPAISPDATKLAYTVSDGTGNRHIWVAEPKNNKKIQLPILNNNHYQAMWSPDGTRIAFSIYTKANRWKVGVINSDYTGYTILDSTSVKEIYSPTWKNDKELVGHDLVNLYTLNLSESVTEIQPLATLIGNEVSFSSSNRFFYTKDGKKLIFNAETSDVVTDQVGPIEAVYVFDLASKKLSRITPQGLNVPYVYVAADDVIFFSAAKASDSDFKIYAADLNGKMKIISDTGMNPTGALK